MIWTNFKALSEGQKVYGLDTNGHIFISVGITVEKIFPDGVVIVRHDYGEAETMRQDTKYLIKENP